MVQDVSAEIIEGDLRRMPRGVASRRDLTVFLNASASSPASTSLSYFPIAAPLAFLSYSFRPMEGSRGLLSYYLKMDLIESLFVTKGEPDPWSSIIYPR